MTKIELQQANTRLAQENDQLRHQVSQLEEDIRRITAVASALNAGNSVNRRAQAMEQARAEARATGRCIKVVC